MARRYQDSVQILSTSARQFNSVVAHLCLLATFVQARGGTNDALRAQTLAEIAHLLDPEGAPCKFKPDAVKTDPQAESTDNNGKPAGKAGGGKHKRSGRA